MADLGQAIDRLKERAYGHPEIWECTLDEFIDKALPVIMEHRKKNNIKSKVIDLAIQFLRIKFDQKELKGTINYEVSQAIQESMMYYVNCLGEDI